MNPGLGIRAAGALAAGFERRHAVVIGVIALHLAAMLGFFVDFRVPLALLLGVGAVIVALEQPLGGLALLIVGRITSTGANAWVRIGKINVDLFEPSLLLCLGALVAHAAVHRNSLWRPVPWRSAVAGLLIWQVAGLTWSTDPKGAAQEIVATGVLLATTLAITTFASSWQAVRGLMYAWIGASLFIAVASFVGLGASDSSAFEMAQGSRESGFGQHPNWFAMNLSFAVLPAAGLGLVDRNRWRGAALLAVSLVVFFAQMQSGSRGGTGSLLISAGIVALLDARFRKVALIGAPIVALVVGVVIAFDVGDASNAFARIFTEGSSAAVLGKSVRVSNWQVCGQMFVDTWGRGIGGGGYEELLAKYDWWLYTSQYKYPHGVFWGLMAHYGAPGILAGTVFVLSIVRMTRDLLRWTADPRCDGPDLSVLDARVVALCMAGSMFGYFAWSWVEFMYDDKPFWEFVGLFTALWAVVGARAKAAGVA